MLVLLVRVSLAPEELRSLLLRQGGAGEAVSATGLKTKGRRINAQSRREQLQVGSSDMTGWKQLSDESNFEGLHLKKAAETCHEHYVLCWCYRGRSRLLLASLL